MKDSRFAKNVVFRTEILGSLIGFPLIHQKKRKKPRIKKKLPHLKKKGITPFKY